MEKDLEMSKVSFKQLSNAQKLEYIWDYYKFHLLTVLFILFLVIAGIFYLRLDARPDILNGYLLNSNWGDDKAQELLQAFADANGYDLEKGNAYFNSSVYIDVQLKDQMSSVAYTKVMSDLDMKRTDFYFCNQEMFDYFGEKEAFLNLETALSEDTLNKYQDRLITTTTYNEDGSVAETYAAGIDISDSPVLATMQQEGKIYEDGTIIFSIPYNTTRLDTSLEFLEFLFYLKESN